MIITKEEEFIKNTKTLEYERQKIKIECDSCKVEFTGYIMTFLPKKEHLCNRCNQKRIAPNKKNENNNPTHKKFWLAQGLSKEEAEKKVRERFPKFVDYWILKGVSIEEAKQKVKEELSKNMWNLEHIAKRDGISLEDSYKKIEDDRNKVSVRVKKNYSKEQTVLCKEYWMKKGHSEEWAKEKILEMQRERHAKVDRVQAGKKTSEAMKKRSVESKLKSNEKRNKTILEKFGGVKYMTPISKYYWLKQGFSEEESKFRAFNARIPDAISGKNISSKIEERFFQSILKITNNEFTFKRNAFLSIKKVFKRFIPDIRYQKIIIEFYGTSVHLDPRFYDISSKNPWGRSFEDVRKQDEERTKLLEENGYKVLEIWEYDFRNNKEETLNQIKKILEDYREKYEKN